MEKISLAWSGGKDCTLALRELQKEKYEIAFHTTLNKDTARVGMHGIRKELIEAQAKALDIPVVFLHVPSDSTNESYESVLNAYYKDLSNQGIDFIGFGDLFLEDLKAYRDKILASHGLRGVYPLWKQDTQILSRKFIDLGFKTTICASQQFPGRESLAGSKYDHKFLDHLPLGVDPCGENGEFHSFVHGGPNFSYPLDIRVGKAETHFYHYKTEEGEAIEKGFDFVDLELVT